MPTWEDLERRLEIAVENITKEMAEAIDDAADILVSFLSANTPIGRGPTPFLHRAMTTRSQVAVHDTSVWVGVAPLSLLGDPAQKAPQHTIAEFLEWWRAEVPDYDMDVPTMGIGGQTIAFHPWWSLSPEQKDALEEERGAGLFGGRPPTAPYWYVQEAGDYDAMVEPQGYAEASWNSALPLIRARILQMRLL